MPARPDEQHGVGPPAAEEMLEQLALGMLNASEAKPIEARLREDKALRKRYEAMRREALAMRELLAAQSGQTAPAPLDETDLGAFLDRGLSAEEEERMVARLSHDRASQARLADLYREVQACAGRAGPEADAGPVAFEEREIHPNPSADADARPLRFEGTPRRRWPWGAALHLGSLACWLAAAPLPPAFHWPVCMAGVLLYQASLLGRRDRKPAANLGLGYSLGIAGFVLASWGLGVVFPIGAPWFMAGGLSAMTLLVVRAIRKEAAAGLESKREFSEGMESPADKNRKSAHNG